MTIGYSPATAEGVLSAIFQASAFVATDVWVKLHVGDPGAAGTANPAGETVRKDASACFGTPPSSSGGTTTIANDTEIGPWTSVTTAEHYTHASFWDDATAGAFLGSATLAADPVAVGDDWSIPIGGATTALPTAA